MCALLISPQADIDHVVAVSPHSRERGGAGTEKGEIRVSEGVVAIRHTH